MSELIELTTNEAWSSLLNDSTNQPVVLLKHSTTCPISGNAWKEFQNTLTDLDEKGVKTAFVKVIESRPVSLHIAEEIGITHQSPQLILIKDKQATWNTSHWDITRDAILKHI